MVFFMAYADEKLNDIDTKIKECNDNNGSACYELGQYYSKSSEENSTNKMFYFYEKGCAKKHDESCIKEIGLIRNDNKNLMNFIKFNVIKYHIKREGIYLNSNVYLICML